MKGGQKNRQDVDNSNIGRIGQSPEEKKGQEKTAEKVTTETVKNIKLSNFKNVNISAPCSIYISNRTFRIE